MARVLTLIPHAMAVFIAIIFIDSLRFKFTNHPNTQTIFGKLDAWAAGLGAPGLFAQTGLFSQYVIGSIEALAASLLLLGLIPGLRHLQAMGALAGVLVMIGAVSFHTLTPLGLDPNEDGGLLFVAAVVNLVFGLVLLGVFRRDDLVGFGQRVGALFTAAA